MHNSKMADALLFQKDDSGPRDGLGIISSSIIVQPCDEEWSRPNRISSPPAKGFWQNFLPYTPRPTPPCQWTDEFVHHCWGTLTTTATSPFFFDKAIKKLPVKQWTTLIQEIDKLYRANQVDPLEFQFIHNLPTEQMAEEPPVSPSSPMIPSRSKLQQGIEELREKGNIPGYNKRVAGCFVPLLTGNMLVAAFVDTGATITIISARIANLLTKLLGIKGYHTDVRAEVFGESNVPVEFVCQMDVPMAFLGGRGRFQVQVLDNMELDCILGDDVLNATGMILNYGERYISTLGHRQRMMTRGEVLTIMAQTQDLYNLVYGPTGLAMGPQ